MLSVCSQIMWFHSHLMWFLGTTYSQLIWFQTTDVVGQDRLCSRFPTLNRSPSVLISDLYGYYTIGPDARSLLLLETFHAPKTHPGGRFESLLPSAYPPCLGGNYAAGLIRHW